MSNQLIGMTDDRSFTRKRDESRKQPTSLTLRRKVKNPEAANQGTSRSSKREPNNKQLMIDGNRGKRNLKKVFNTQNIHDIYMDPKLKQNN